MICFHQFRVNSLRVLLIDYHCPFLRETKSSSYIVKIIKLL